MLAETDATVELILVSCMQHIYKNNNNKADKIELGCWENIVRF